MDLLARSEERKPSSRHTTRTDKLWVPIRCVKITFVVVVVVVAAVVVVVVVVVVIRVA